MNHTHGSRAFPIKSALTRSPKYWIGSVESAEGRTDRDCPSVYLSKTGHSRCVEVIGDTMDDAINMAIVVRNALNKTGV